SDDGKYTRYYPAADFDEADQTVMNALRREYSRRILAHLLSDGPLSTTELSDRLDKAQSTVSWHLSKLADADLVTKERDGRSVVYEVTNPDRVTYLYTIHRQSFTDRVVDRLLGLWDGY
ncbi:MAG: winged helix-turn-helix transcriptional regulator, partial [Halobacteriaceae archaeon]